MRRQPTEGSLVFMRRSEMDSQQQLSRWLAMADTTAKRSISKDVESKVSQCKCLICDKPANGNRGLCVSHHLQFYRAMNDLPRKDRPAFEEEQIREGRILASGQISRLKKPNPFRSENRAS